MKSNFNKGMKSTNTVEWGTPQEFFEELNLQYGPFDLDPCATVSNRKCDKFFTREVDGLSQPWAGRVFMNPPYGTVIKDWVKKAATCGTFVVALLPARVDTRWWHEFCEPNEYWFVKGRLSFVGGQWSAPFPSAIVIFNGGKQFVTKSNKLKTGECRTMTEELIKLMVAATNYLNVATVKLSKSAGVTEVQTVAAPSPPSSEVPSEAPQKEKKTRKPRAANKVKVQPAGMGDEVPKGEESTRPQAQPQAQPQMTDEQALAHVNSAAGRYVAKFGTMLPGGKQAAQTQAVAMLKEAPYNVESIGALPYPQKIAFAAKLDAETKGGPVGV